MTSHRYAAGVSQVIATSATSPASRAALCRSTPSPISGGRGSVGRTAWPRPQNGVAGEVVAGVVHPLAVEE